MRKYLVEYRCGSEELIDDAFDIREAREEAQRRQDSPIRRIRVIRNPDEIPVSEPQSPE